MLAEMRLFHCSNTRAQTGVLTWALPPHTITYTNVQLPTWFERVQPLPFAHREILWRQQPDLTWRMIGGRRKGRIQGVCTVLFNNKCRKTFPVSASRQLTCVETCVSLVSDTRRHRESWKVSHFGINSSLLSRVIKRSAWMMRLLWVFTCAGAWSVSQRWEQFWQTREQ